MVTLAEQEIRRKISNLGKLPFSEFMELALYHEIDGYYSRHHSIGSSGDYYTSSLSHPAFGALIAIQLHSMWESLGHPSNFYAIELGMGTGQLARDIKNYLPNLPGHFQSALRYIGIDRSSGMIRHQEDTSIQTITSNGLPMRGLVGCIFSNELLDSFPTHRFKTKHGKIKEVYITLTDDNLGEIIGDPSTPLISEKLLGINLKEGLIGEVNLGIRDWMKEVAQSLERGFVLTIDYGFEAAELYSEKHQLGTLQTYFRHTRGNSPYENIGRQDLTTHVDFSSVIQEGIGMGLQPLILWTQSDFLNALGMSEWLNRIRTNHLAQLERDSNMMAMRGLTRQPGLGNFKVLLQEKATGITNLSSLCTTSLAKNQLPIPLLQKDHIRLFESVYPHAGWTFKRFDSEFW